MSGLYNMSKADFDTTLDLTKNQTVWRHHE